MNCGKLEIYEPRKNFYERITPLLKPALRLFGILFIITLTVFATKYTMERTDNEVYDILKDWHNGITGNIVSENNIDIQKNLNQDKNKIVEIKDDKIEEIKRETDYSTLISDLSNSDIVKDLPSNAVLNLKFYNFNSGYREWENSYALKKNSVTEGEEESDIQIIIDSKYVSDFKDKNVCKVLTNANNNGDFGVDTEMSEGELMWKYKSMIKYRDCLGI